jgi:3-deoxy-D-manno-octulosonic-acid transferase
LISRFIYNAFLLPLGKAIFYIVALFDKKAKRGLDGRENLFARLESGVARLKPGAKRIWFHSSSMGEFEQAKPIIAELRLKHPEVEIVVSFFSPSGFDHSRTYKNASLITYIPLDSASNARRFISLVKPTAAVMVRYDVWPNHIWALHEAHIPVFIANATLAANSARALPFAKQFHRVLYNAIDYILTVSEDDKKAFDNFGLRGPIIEVIGDTRFDQVVQRSADSAARQVLPESFIEGRRFLVVGSNWEEDDEHLVPAILRLLRDRVDLGVILVPHEPNEETLERLEIALNGNVPITRFSTLAYHHRERVVLVDSVGILMTLYKYAHVAYVGGSFKQGIHNVLEPASYNVPVVFGPKHDNSQEAKALAASGGAFVTVNAEEMFDCFNSLFDSDLKRDLAGKKAGEFVRSHAGATRRFLAYLEKVL